jgi:hypothetical protein
MTYRYVLHDRVPDYLRCGWMALPSLEGTHHGHYSTLCVWLCTCAVSSPVRTGEA